MRIRLWPVSLLLAGCSDPEPQSATASASPQDRVECALGGSAQFANACAIERTAKGGPMLTIRHPDGGFRRLQIIEDGRGVVAADGAASATVSVVADKRIEVAVDGDRYRLPATVKGQ